MDASNVRVSTARDILRTARVNLDIAMARLREAEEVLRTARASSGCACAKSGACNYPAKKATSPGENR